MAKTDDRIAALNKFLVGNSELEELSAILSVFNIFSVLRIEKAEIRHSNVLAWLLDPRESHGLGDSYLRRFLSTLLMESEWTSKRIGPAHIELMPLQDVEVWREWKNIDLIAFSKENRWLLLMENKIKSGSKSKQLLRYKQLVEKEFKKFVVIPLLLTLHPDDGLEAAEEADFINWSHAQSYHVLDYVFNLRKDRVPSEARFFLEDYLTVLRRLTMQDKKIMDLCKEIYKKHQAAIDLIMEYGAASQFEAAAESFISENKQLLQLSMRPHSAWFIPKEWTKTMTACSNRWKHLSEPYPVACWFIYKQNRSKIGLIIEVGSMEDQAKRMKLIHSLQKENFKFRKKTFQPGSKYSRFYSHYLKIENDDNLEEIRAILNELWQKSKTDIDKTGKVIKSFRW